MQQHLKYAVLNLEELQPYHGNARQHDDRTLKTSVKVHGQYRTLVVRQLDDGTYVLLAGHGTADALRSNGHTKARVELVSCSDEEALAISLMDNRGSDLASYDDALLAMQLEQVQDMDLWELTGWDEKAAAKYLNPHEETEEMDEDPPTYGVIINCSTEEEQAKLLDRLAGEGLSVRALMG